MQHTRFVLVVITCLLVARSPAAPPPLVVDRDAPLLLGGPPPHASAVPLADNTACFVCHANFEEEPLARGHAAAEVGCVDCHGDSFAHRNDENNTTPPEVMFPAAKIDAACRECHQEHVAPAAAVIARLLERCPDKTDGATLVCTNCHGRHRMKVRTVHWDKATGKLITARPRQ